MLGCAYSKPNHLEASTTLADFESLLISHPSPIDSTVLKLTRKIFQKFGYSLHCVLPKLYIKYLKLVNKGNTELLISLCNDALLVKDSLIGTEIGEQIGGCVREALIFLVQQGSLDIMQSQEVQKLLEVKITINFEEELGNAIEELDLNSAMGMHVMMDLFSSMPSLKDQFYYYSTQISPILKALHPRKSVEIYNLTLKFIDIFLAPTRYLITIGEKSMEYQISHLKLFSMNEDVFYTSIALVKILLKCDRIISESTVKIIYKLWNLYPGLRGHLHEVVLAAFKIISTSAAAEPRRKAAEFLYVIMHDKGVEGDFKGRLESEGLESLFEDENYDRSELVPIALKDLKVSTGYPICYEIKAGEKYSHFVEVEEGNSVLAWGFASEEYDISYTISRMGSVEEIIHRDQRCNCDLTPIHGVEFVARPGLYRFEWSNEFSWFRSKKVRFRISVLVPLAVKQSVEEARVILLQNPDECGDLCYILPNIEFAEVGICVSKDSISFYSGEIDIFPLKPSDDVPAIISRYCGLIQKKVKKIGVIEKSIERREYLLSSGCFALCRDVDAFALMSHDSLQVHSLIAVIEENGLRSAVVIGGRLFNGGNVANFKNQDPAIAIAALLSLFGPATVVVSGLPIEKYIAKIRILVPVGIWNNSKVVLSGFSLAECAARLHYLLYRYKSSL